MNKAIILQGLPASGKTAWAKNYQKKHKAKRVNRDDLRKMIDDSVWSKDNEKFIRLVRDMIITAAIMNGNDVIIDDTNLQTLTHLRNLIKVVSPSTEIIVKKFDTPVKECIARDRNRLNSVGAEVIKKMYERSNNI